MKRELTLTDIAGYLPYGLNYQWTNMKSVRLISTTGEVDYGSQHSLSTAWEWMKHGQARPILRPMSDLTKEITHRGEKITPLLVLANLSYPSDKWAIRDGRATTTNPFEGEEFRYEDGDFILDDVHYDGTSFAGTTSTPMELRNQVAILDRLAEWLFDYRGLIPAGLAVSVHDLPTNPYEA